MRLVVFDDDRLGVLHDEIVIDATQVLRERGFQAPEVDLAELVREWEMLAPALEALKVRHRGRPLADCTLRAPVGRPRRIVCLPPAHGAGARDAAACQSWAGRAYLRAPTRLLDPGGVLALPPRAVDYEAGLAVVVGPAAGGQALAPFAYTVAAALLARGWEERSLRGSRDGFLALGPALVTADECGPADALRAQVWHNETPRLGAGRNPRQVAPEEAAARVDRRALRFGVTDALAALREWLTLAPGDVVLPGSQWPARRLLAGDHLRVTVEPLGTLTMRAAPD